MTKTSAHPLSTPELEVRRGGIHGLGVFAKRRFNIGGFIGNYDGSRHPPGREIESDNNLTYLFLMSDGWTIDGSNGGNATRHMNHSCVPNCSATEELRYDGVRKIVCHAILPIKKGQEITIDYQLSLEAPDLPVNYVCCCGEAACRGTMAGAT